MFLYGIVILLVGISLFSGATMIAVWLHRRFSQPYALLTVGILTYILSLLVQFVLLQMFDRALLEILPIGALILGLLAGFTEETARLLGYQYLARSAVTKPQSLMIGVGHGFSETVYTGLLAAGLGLSLLGYGTDPPDDVAAVLSGALAEACNAMLPILMHMALSWLVLQVFLRGEMGWLFVAISIHAVAEIMAVLLGPNDDWAVVVWRALVALIGLAVIAWLRPPKPEPGESAA
jgi:uncharacterized membrane protein YhfC